MSFEGVLYHRRQTNMFLVKLYAEKGSDVSDILSRGNTNVSSAHHSIVYDSYNKLARKSFILIHSHFSDFLKSPNS